MTQAQTQSPAQPLSGIRVLDLTVMVAGPIGTLLLADLGADVVKVEEAAAGDLSRNMGTIFSNGESVQFLSSNRNKRSLRVDLKKPEGRELFLRLARNADVITENFRPGTVDRLGIGYEAVSAVNPGIIYASLSAFGQTGPYAARPANDPIVQALSGVMDSTGEADGTPSRVSFPFTDVASGITLAFGVVSALHHRLRTGVGQRLDLSLLNVTTLTSIPRDGETLVTGESPQRQGSAHGAFAPYQNFKGSDGTFVFLSCFTERLWGRLCDALGEEGWKTDVRFVRNADRVANLSLLQAELDRRFAQRTSDEWIEHLSRFEVPVAKVQDLHTALTVDPQLRHNKILVEQTHPRAGTIRTLSHPVNFDRTPASYTRPPPRLGEHSTEVLHDFSIADTEIARLIAARVVLDMDD